MHLGGSRSSEGEEGADEDRGGRVGLDHLLSETDPVNGGGQSPGKAVAGQAGGDRPEGDRGGRAPNYALNLERIWANQRRADALCRRQGKAILRRGHFKID